MLEAKLEQASLLKKVVECLKDLITDCNIECSEEGISLQALESSHIVLISLMLEQDAFSDYRNDRNLTLGLNLKSLGAVLKCAGNEDTVTLRANDDKDALSLTFEDSKRDRISEFNLKLMNIDQEYLSIPECEYIAVVTMPSAELQRICRDFSGLSGDINIEANKEGVTFSASGEHGSGSIHYKSHNDLQNPEQSVIVHVEQSINPSFNLKYFNIIAKASALSETVTFKLVDDLPSLFEYKLPNGHFRYYFAPKIGDEEEEEDSK